MFVANKALWMQTPSWRHNDGLDYSLEEMSRMIFNDYVDAALATLFVAVVSTDRYVLYGHRFAAVAGAGALVGPVLGTDGLSARYALDSGPRARWRDQDMTVLFFSTRRDGRLAGEIVRLEMVVASVVYGFINIPKALGSAKAPTIEVGLGGAT
jgi:carbon starvation protein CstA